MISKSAIETWYSCPKKFQFTYVDGYESIYKPSETKIGIAGHAILEQQLFLEGGTPLGDLGLHPTDRAKLDLTIKHFLKMVDVPSPDELELPFEIAELGIKGIFDGISKNGSSVTILEHKFTKTDISTSDWWWEQWKTSWQVGLYQLAARKLYNTTDVSVWLNAIRVPQLRQGKSESTEDYLARIDDHIGSNPEKYFMQANVWWSEESLERMEYDLRGARHVIDTASRANDFPRSRNCLQYMRKCEFYPVCFEGKSLTDETLYKIRTRK